MPPKKQAEKACDTAYCVKCKKKQSMINCKAAKTANGRSMVKGNCKVCDCKMNKFVSSS